MCLYKPWTVEQREEYEGDLEVGFKRSEQPADSTGRDSRRRQRYPPPAELAMTAQDEKVVEVMIMAIPSGFPQSEAETTAARTQERQVHKARKPKKPRVEVPTSPIPESSAGVVDALEVVIDVPKEVAAKDAATKEKEKFSKKGGPKTAKRPKIVELDDLRVAAAAAKAVPSKPLPSDGTIRRRKMQKHNDWFDPEQRAVSVPETVRYYLSPTDGQPIVSWRDPEAAGRESKLPPGTLFADGNMVNIKGQVKAPADRRANHVCEACRAR